MWLLSLHFLHNPTLLLEFTRDGKVSTSTFTQLFSDSFLKLSESYRLHDTWIMKVSCSSSHYEGNADVYPQHWPFQTETKRAKLPSTKLAGFIAWGESPSAPCLSSPSFIRAAAPYADFDRLVWASRLTGLLILEDDLVNNEDHSTERIAGFKHVAAGNGVSVIIHKWRHRY